jgi:FkbM family methyltransferase
MIARIKNSIRKRFFKKNRGWTIETFHTYGFKMLLNLDSYLDYRLYLSSEYETETLNCLSRIINGLKSRSVWFVDVGSNIGLMSVFVKKNFQHVIVDALEPVQINYCQNFINQNINQVQYNLHRVLLGATNDDNVKVYLNDDVLSSEWNKLNYGMSSSYKNKYHSGKRSEECRMITFDKFISNGNLSEMVNTHSIVIKIDVEGAELDVIEGMNELLKKKEKDIYVLAELFFSESIEKCLNVINTFNLLGFFIFDLGGERIAKSEIRTLKDGQYLFQKDSLNQKE